MPIYEYACSNCGTRFDALRPMKDADKKIDCVHCHSGSTHRVQTACFSRSGTSTSTASSSGCAGCSGGTCSTCGH